MESRIRRIVTGHDPQGQSIILEDRKTPHVKTSPHRPGVVINNLWLTEDSPVNIDQTADPVSDAMKLEPQSRGNNFRIVEFPPEAEYIDKIDAQDAQKAFGDMGASHALSDTGESKHPFMHKTQTLDYAIVLSGEITLVMDEDETVMRAGDVCIQRATNHVWSNRSDKMCQIAFVLIDAAGD